MSLAAVTALALLAAAAGAQQLDLRGPDPAVIAVGEAAVIVLRVDDADALAALGALPATAGLELSADPPVHSSCQMFRAGRVVDGASASWRLVLTAQRVGTFTLPPFAATNAGTTLTSAEARLEVLPDLQGGEHAFVEVAVDGDTFWLQQPLDVTLRFGFAAGFAEEGLIAMFARPLDLPVQVRWSWVAAPMGAALLPAADAAGGARVRFALDDEVALATRGEPTERNGKTFTTFTVKRRVVATSSGELTIAPPVLRFAFATRFDDDFVNGRVAADRHEGCVRAETRTLHIRPLPATGRPPEFTGAVGTFAVHARASTAVVRAGDDMRIVMTVSGTGNLSEFAPPTLTLPGLHAYGCVSEVRDGARVLTYDVTPLRTDVVEVPPLAFAFFDPTAGGYRTIHTDSLALTVRPGDERAPAAATQPVLVAGSNDIYPPCGEQTNGDPHLLSPAQVASVLGVPWLLALVIWRLQRARDRTRSDPLGERARRAAAVFAARRNASGSELADAFADYLAARLRCARAAVVGPDLDARLAAAGIPAALATRTARALQDLLAIRYGGAQVASDTTVPALVGELEAHFVARANRS